MNRKFHDEDLTLKKLERIDDRIKAEENYLKDLKVRQDFHEKELAKHSKMTSNFEDKVFKTLKEQHVNDLNELKAKHDGFVHELSQENSDEYSIADSMFSSAFVNTFSMKELSNTLRSTEKLNSKSSSAMDLDLDLDEEKKDYEEEDKRMDGLPLSPRTVYIDGCIRSNLNPRTSLILRKTLTKEVIF